MRIKDVIGPEDLEGVTALQKDQQNEWRLTSPEGEIMLVDGHEFLVLPGVFPPRSDTSLIIRNLQVPSKASVLDVGTGSGVLAIFACRLGATNCVALDINPDAVRNAKENAVMHGVTSKIDARVSDGLTAVGSKEYFDLVIANLPGRDAEAKDFVEGAQWDGGFKIHKAFFNKVSDHLSDDGQIIMVKANYPELNDLLAYTENLGFKARIVDKRPPLEHDPRTYYVLSFALSKARR